MIELSWLTIEAHKLNQYFTDIFYVLMGTFIAICVVTEFFKFPIGAAPNFSQFVGRALVAMVLLISYKEVSNAAVQVTQQISESLGGFDNLDGVLKKMGEKVENFEGDWLNARSMVVSIISLLTYSFLFYSVMIAEAAHTFIITLLFVFSPILICLYIIPATATATKALYRSLFEVSCWKIVWVCLSNLLWSSVLVNINENADIDLIQLIFINLMLGGSLVATPWIVNSLTGAGLAGISQNFAQIRSPMGVITQSSLAASVKKNTISKVTSKFRRS